MSNLPEISIPENIIEQAVELAMDEHRENTRYMIFGSEYRGDAEEIANLVDKYVLQLMEEETNVALCKT